MSAVTVHRSVLVLAMLAAAVGCRKSQPSAPAGEAPPPPLQVVKDKPALYTHVQPDGRFETTDRPDAVPEVARRLVRVIDPSVAVDKRRDTTAVYVVDVDELLARGRAAARVMSREAFETGALAQLPPGASSLLADRPTSPPGEAAAADGGAAAAEGDVVVTVYGTSWCGACKEARRYLAERKIPFADKDIEKDPAAARELAEKAARLGVPSDRVPILDVRGRLLVGFDRGRLEALLGEAT